MTSLEGEWSYCEGTSRGFGISGSIRIDRVITNLNGPNGIGTYVFFNLRRGDTPINLKDFL